MSPSPLLTTTCLHLCSQNTTQHTHRNYFSSIIHSVGGKIKKLFSCTALLLYTYLENEKNCSHLGQAPCQGGLVCSPKPLQILLRALNNNSSVSASQSLRDLQLHRSDSLNTLPEKPALLSSGAGKGQGFFGSSKPSSQKRRLVRTQLKAVSL